MYISGCAPVSRKLDCGVLHQIVFVVTTRSKARRYMAVWTALVLSLCLFTVPASAAGGDPLDIVNNLSDFIFSIIKALGVIILGWGIVQVGMSIQLKILTVRSVAPLALAAGLRLDRLLAQQLGNVFVCDVEIIE